VLRAAAPVEVFGRRAQDHFGACETPRDEAFCAHAILRPVDALCLYQFSEIVEEVTPFTSDLKRIDNGINHVRQGSATAMYDAMYLGSRALETQQGRKVMVVITDGGDTVSRVDYKEALRAAQEAEAIVYSVIIVPIEASAGRDSRRS